MTVISAPPGEIISDHQWLLSVPPPGEIISCYQWLLSVPPPGEIMSYYQLLLPVPHLVRLLVIVIRALPGEIISDCY